MICLTLAWNKPFYNTYKAELGYRLMPDMKPCNTFLTSRDREFSYADVNGITAHNVIQTLEWI